MSNNEIHAPIFHELEIFFQELSKFELKLKKHKKPFHKFNTSKLAPFYVSLGNAIKKNNLSLIPRNEFNVWRAAGIKHLEVQNCNVLAAIFHADINEGFGRELLARICETIGYPNISAILRSGQKYKVATELAIKDSGVTKRIDVAIEAKDFVIFFEVKIYHFEDNKQLTSYINEIKSYKIPERDKVIIFITRTSEKSRYVKQGNRKYIRNMSWNWLIIEIYDLLESHKFRNSDFRQSIHYYLRNTKKYF